ncbi:MAG: hypothetical protein H7067_00805, partial [Burkholderiales bacterium]|nr:hypothetical protein [Opitutaceae bacterium]
MSLATAAVTLHAQDEFLAPVAGGSEAWVRWIGWLFVVMALGGLLVFWINLRLQGQVGRQTKALRA